jgi:hypothetical protein
MIDNAKIIEAAKYIYDVKQLDQMLQAVTRCELAERERLYGDMPTAVPLLPAKEVGGP